MRVKISIITIFFLIFIATTIRAAPPTLSSPSDYAIYNRNNTSSVTFSWSSTGALEYWINIFPSGNSSNPKLDASTGTSTSRSVSISTWAPGVYIWQVRERTSAGWSSYSSARQFIVDIPPDAPVLGAPSIGTSYPLGGSGSFSWSGPSGASVARYTFRIVSGTDLNQNQKVHKDPATSPNNETFSDATYDPGTHTWGARAIKITPPGYNQSIYETTIGWGPYATRSFTILSPPSPPPLSSPSDYAIYNRNKTSSITFSWSSVSGALEYWVNVFPSGNSSNSLFDASTGTSASKSLSISSWTPGVYIWQVKVRTSAGWSNYSSARQFIVDIPPNAPTLNAPASGAAYSLGGSGSFSWSAPSGASVERYTFRIVSGTDLNQNQLLPL